MCKLSTQWGKKEKREPSSEMRASSKIGNACWRWEEANSSIWGWCESAFIACVSHFTSTAPASLDVNPSDCRMQEPAGLQSIPTAAPKHTQAAAPGALHPWGRSCSQSQHLPLRPIPPGAVLTQSCAHQQPALPAEVLARPIPSV